MRSQRFRFWVSFVIPALAAAGLWFISSTARADEPAKPKPSSKPAEKAKPAVAITLDTSAAPEMADWAAKSKKICEDTYPMICRELASEGFKPPTKVRITFKDSRGVAWTSGTRIVCCKDWFQKHPEDYGAVVHEMCHVVQSYWGKEVPSWLCEGIADYVRWFVYEPADRRPHVRGRNPKYTDSYQTTAAFLDWIVRNKDKTFVKRMNAACREGNYKVELWKEYAGKPLDDLWTEFMAAQKKK